VGAAIDGTHAILVKDNSAAGAQYKGLALSAGGKGSLLYATDFHNGKIDVWDTDFNPVTLAAGAFTDPAIPNGFAPFGIQAINGNIYVTYAKQDADRHDDVAGKGLGYVDVYDPTARCSTASCRRGRSTRRGAWRSLPRGSASSAAACSSATSATVASMRSMSRPARISVR
jgi:uncharacterized protein (TIGR03118 family)